MVEVLVDELEISTELASSVSNLASRPSEAAFAHGRGMSRPTPRLCIGPREILLGERGIELTSLAGLAMSAKLGMAILKEVEELVRWI